MKKTRKRLLAIGIILLAGFALLNVLAYNHAHSMIYFTSDGPRTHKPEAHNFLSKIKVMFSGVNIPRPVSQRTPSDLNPDCTKLSFGSTDESQLATWYVDRGNETPLVILFHGYAAEKSCLLREARLFLELGASVMLVDFRGSGDSSESYTTLGYHEGDDVAAAYQYARNNLDHSAFILFGQSMGAAAVLRAAHEHSINPDAVILDSVFDTLLNAVRNRFQLMGVPSFPCAELLVFWGEKQADFDGFAHQPGEYAKSLNCPTVFMHGAEDQRTSVEEARRVFTNHPGPKEFMVFPATGHGACAAVHPEKWRVSVVHLFNEIGISELN